MRGNDEVYSAAESDIDVEDEEMYSAPLVGITTAQVVMSL